MKKKFIFYTAFLSITLAGVLFFNSCDQYMSREFGGSTTITLKPGEKLIEATWKDDGNIWYLVEPMDSDYVPKTKVFKESSLYGVMNGEVIFIERR